MPKSFISTVIVAAFALMLGCGKKADDRAPQPPIGTQPPTQPPGPDPNPKRAPLGEPKYRVTTKQLLTESVADKQKYLEKYLGQVVEVTGTTLTHAVFDVSDVLQSPPPARVAGYGAQVIFMENQPNQTAGMDSVSIYIRGLDRESLAKVFKGQRVAVKGRAEKFLSYLLLKETELVDAGQEKSIRLNSEAVAAEASKSLDELVKKCETQTLVISGTVIGQVNEGEDTFTELKGDGKTRVLCKLNDGALYLFNKGFVTSDAVTFSATVSKDFELQQPGRVIVRDCIPLHRQPNAAEATKR